MPAKADLDRAWRKTFRFLSSVRLAVILLMVLIVAIAVGTLCESRFDTKVARAYVYDAPWFDGWMILLGINLAFAAFSRYPWKPHHTGFVITHAGIITLLVGALVGRLWGIEGTMTIFEGEEPSNRLVIDEQVVRIQEADHVTEIPVGLHHAQPGKPIALGATPGGWQVTETDYAEMLLPVSSPQPVNDGGSPALNVKLWSMGQNIDEWLWPDDPQDRQINLGLLAIECRRGTAPPASRHAGVVSLKSVFQPAAMTSATSGNVPVNSGQNAAAAVPAPELPPGDRAVIYLSSDNKISYYIQTKKGDVSQGALEAGKPMATGWGNWQMEVAQVMPQAVPNTEFRPIPKETKMPPRQRANLTNGIKLQFTKGDQHDEEWLANGWQVDLPGPDQSLHASFGPRIYQMPISLTLQDFSVERQEGSDSPAGFKSTLLVRDAAGNSATGSCSMNEPMSFPDTFWRKCLGLTFKISQASWNPDNLKQSSVQILLDPGWLFKWVGSLMVCTGIFTMFYLRPPRTAAHP